MNRRMATAAEAGPFIEPRAACRSVTATSHTGIIRLAVTSQAEIRITNRQHLVVDRPMHLVTSRAPFSQRFMLINKWPALFFMTLETGLIHMFDGGRRPWLCLY